METFRLILPNSGPVTQGKHGTLVGVVGSGNLEILIEQPPDFPHCQFEIVTTVAGFQSIWHAVTQEFMAQHAIGSLLFTIHDGGAVPALVMLRLNQALAAFKKG